MKIAPWSVGPSYHHMAWSQPLAGGGSLQMCEVTASAFKNQERATDKVWSFSLWVGELLKPYQYRNLTRHNT